MLLEAFISQKSRTNRMCECRHMCKYIFKPICIHTYIYKQNQCHVYTHTHILLLLFMYQYIKRFLYLLVYKYSFLFIYTKIFINMIRKWLMQLWKLLSLKICSRQARVPENWWWGSSLKAGWAETSASIQVWRQGRKKKIFKLRQSDREKCPLPQPFCSLCCSQIFTWLDETHPP